MTWTLLLHLTDAQAAAVNLPAGSTAYLKAYDVDALDGLGMAQLTTDLAEAIRWPDAVAAIAAWRTRSTVRPTRGDGKANRPLTAYTAETVNLEPPTLLKGHAQ